ncbi:hypothetical protein [Gilliamella apis]|uniref:hypothetical protein n=1 Tax=Gilliamella apis TaxID=1970738 RepID=UPI0015E8E610|nr:hypothetical protein [Gilliamella apis]
MAISIRRLHPSKEGLRNCLPSSFAFNALAVFFPDKQLLCHDNLTQLSALC